MLGKGKKIVSPMVGTFMVIFMSWDRIRKKTPTKTYPRNSIPFISSIVNIPHLSIYR